MRGDEEDIVAFVKNILRAVAVMDTNIHDGETFCAESA